MKRLNKNQTFRLLLTITATMAFATAPAVAQNDHTGGQDSPDPKASAEITNKVRARRAAGGKAPENPADAAKTSDAPPHSRAASESKPVPSSDAISTLRDQIDAAPNAQERSRLQLELVGQLVSAGMKQEAVSELHTMTGEERFDPQGFFNIGNALARLGETEGAITAYRKAVDQRKGRYSRALNNLGVLLLKQGKWEEADDVLLRALRLENFRYAEASYNLGRLYDARGETDLAIREWSRALAVDPEHSAAAQALAKAGSEGNIKVAAKTRRSISDKPSSGVTRGSEAATKSPVELSGSRRESPRVLTVDPETYAFLQRARNAREHGRNEEAVENYRRVMSRMGGYFAPANLELSYALITLKRDDEAVASLLPISQKEGSRFPISNYHLARIYERRGDLKLAEEAYSRTAATYRENNSEFLLDVSRVREKLGNFQGALEAMQQYVNTMERQGRKPEWSDERLTTLRQKLAASQTQPKP